MIAPPVAAQGHRRGGRRWWAGARAASRGIFSIGSAATVRVLSWPVHPGLYPWVGFEVTDRLTVWGVGGGGRGSMLLTPGAGPALAADLAMAMTAAGARGELVAGDAFYLAFKADALWVGTSTAGTVSGAGRLGSAAAAVTRYRAALEGGRSYELSRLSLRPTVEVGVRQDGGDAEVGAGLDVGGGLLVVDASGLSVDLRVLTLVVHQAAGFREHGVSVSLGWDPRSGSRLGWTARVAPSWGGETMSGAQALWGYDAMGSVMPGAGAAGDRLDAEVGYGLPLGSRFVGTPRLGLGTSGYGRDLRLGYGVGILESGALSLDVGVDAVRRQHEGGDDTGVAARAAVPW